MPKENYLIILCGLPASGKSYFAQKLRTFIIDTKEGINVSIIDPDKIRKKLYTGEFNYKKEELVRKQNLYQIEKALKSNSIVISDDLNYYTSMRHDLKDIAEKLNVPYYIIHISTPIKQCIAWNEERGTPIPNELIHNISEKFDVFNTYSWDNPFSIFDLSIITNVERKVKNLLQLIEKDIKLTSRKSIRDISYHVKNPANEKLDQITRTIVNQYVKNLNKRSLINQILILRKVFIKQNLNKVMSKSEIAEKFNNFLKLQLKDEKLNSPP